MDNESIELERAQNLWSSFVRRSDPLARGAQLTVKSDFDVADIGGLEGAKEELLTFACAATSPEVYSKWGTFPPSGLLLIGQRGVGKSLLARALASQTGTPFVRVDVPRIVIDIVHAGGKAHEFLVGWSHVLEEMPPLTVFFDELEFSQAQEIGSRRPDLPVGPIMDFLLELVDRTIAPAQHLAIAATSHPDTLRRAFAAPGRFERVVEVSPIFPDDVVAALQIHTATAEKRAGRTLFEVVDWASIVGQDRQASTGDWIRILHAVLRRKARCDAAGEVVELVTKADLENEVQRFKHAQQRIRVSGGGNYV